ncbi:hypothetical protein ANN_13390 [Periplaneta americana]|uniref:Nose resistant-to-fluoxetine protein N-terminal domain-containing protein n=1 Tax=Periplaneta americana TaxID=6978 RepID=A0ABQ8TK99_PERAM|nr:hypothetical protein ANN_13390 [Periplaneta americana]
MLLCCLALFTAAACTSVPPDHSADFSLPDTLSHSDQCRRFNVSERTARRWMQNYQRSAIFGRKAGSGRRKISTPQQDTRLVAEVERNPFHTAATLKAVVNFPGHDQTMRNRLSATNLRSRRAIPREAHKKEHVEERLVFAVGNGDRDWKRVIFSDEVTFSTTKEGPTLVYRPSVEKGREGKGREGKGREGKGREGKGREVKGREGKGREGKGRERKGREGKGREGKGMGGKGKEGKGKKYVEKILGEDFATAATSRLLRRVVSQLPVHVPASARVTNSLCREQSRTVLDAAQHLEMWALKNIGRRIMGKEETIFTAYYSEWIQMNSSLSGFDTSPSLPILQSKNPVLLLLDGHFSHTQNTDLDNLAETNHVIIVSLPPHSSHKLHPLDKTFMGPLKVHYSKEIRQWLRHNERAVSAFDAMDPIGKGYIRCQTAQIAINGFKATFVQEAAFRCRIHCRGNKKRDFSFYESVLKKQTAENQSFPENREECDVNEPQVIVEFDPNEPSISSAVVDSSARLGSGALSGNVNQYGDFDQCLGVAALVQGRRLAGRYCLAALDLDLGNASRASNGVLQEVDDLLHSHRPMVSTVHDPGHIIPKFTTMRWGFCIPASCSSEDLTVSLTESLEALIGDADVSYSLKVDPDLCYIQDSRSFSTGTKLTVLIFICLLGLVLAGTCIDGDKEKQSDVKSVALVKAFSLRKNWRKLLNIDSNQQDISCLHGIRSLNAFALLVFHKAVVLYFSPFVNRTYMVETSSNVWSMVIRTSIIYTDTFILFDGLLTSISFLRELDRSKRIPLWDIFLIRYFRIMPNHLAVLLFGTYILSHLGSGPLWNEVIKPHVDLCQNNMWKNFLYIHNYLGIENMVVVITEDVHNVHLLLEYRPHIDVSLTCEHDPKLQEYCVCPQNMPQFDSEGIPNQAPETNKPVILNGPTSRNREGSDQVSVEAKQLGYLYLSIDQETFDPSIGEPYD